VLTTRGYQEAITYSFVDPKVQQKLFPQIDGMTLPHPISADMSVMRVSLWSGLLPAVVHNQKRQQPRVRLFETGLRFTPDETAPMNIRQEQMLAGVITGTIAGETWNDKIRAVDFYDAKADVEAILAKCVDASSFRFEPVTADDAICVALHPGQAAAIYRNDDLVGYLGAVHPAAEKSLGLNGKTFVFELLLDQISTRVLPEAQPVSKYPANRRDIAVVVSEQVNAGHVLSEIKKIGGNQLVDLNLFDVYRGDGIEQGFKSLAISLVLQDVDRTLEEQDITNKLDQVVEMLKQQFDATLRD